MKILAPIHLGCQIALSSVRTEVNIWDLRLGRYVEGISSERGIDGRELIGKNDTRVGYVD